MRFRCAGACSILYTCSSSFGEGQETCLYSETDTRPGAAIIWREEGIILLASCVNKHAL
jgi:hypothetical protein